MIKRLLFTFGILFCCTSGFAQLIEGKKYSDHYLKRYEQFQQERAINNNDIVFLGNSLTEGGKWSEYFAQTEEMLKLKGGAIINRGIIGDDAPGMMDRLHQILPGKPAKLFLLVGVNDISHNISADSVLVLVERVVERILKESPTTTLYMQSLLPINEAKNRYKSMIGKVGVIKEVNIGLAIMAKKHGVRFIPLYPSFIERGSNQLNTNFTNDGLHINSEGYAVWVKQIEKYVK